MTQQNKLYRGNNPKLYEEYLLGKPIAWRKDHSMIWCNVIPYETPVDIYRVSNPYYEFLVVNEPEIAREFVVHYPSVTIHHEYPTEFDCDNLR